MLELRNRYETEENNIQCIVEEFSDGTTIKYVKPEEQEPSTEVSNAYLTALDTALNTEYLVCLAELGL